MTSLNFANIIADLIKNKKGYNIIILDLRKLSTIADFFVICSADSERQVKAIADEIEDKLSEQRIKCSNREGYETMNWILLDYFDVIVHILKMKHVIIITWKNSGAMHQLLKLVMKLKRHQRNL